MKLDLSQREQQVLDYAVQGYTDDMIAKELGIERGTINSYWVRIRGKMGHLSRTHLVANYLQARAEIDKELAVSGNGEAGDLVKSAQILLEDERTKHRDEVDAKNREAAALAEENRGVLDKAEAEITRLRRLLDKKSK